ncbi:unnamed protein product [Wuchereria bancrofti]|uniref:Uncharacterized protein n=1 Tax=Wuchereria bancrofti TaxID=6293 RepID=A0A3P7DU37_WUCBA|nr:unnamed protein product [Wuchereria bancrofti]
MNSSLQSGESATFPKNDGADNRQKFCLLLLDTVDHTYQTIGPIIHSFKRRAGTNKPMSSSANYPFALYFLHF